MRDGEADEQRDVVREEPASRRSGRTIEEIVPPTKTAGRRPSRS